MECQSLAERRKVAAARRRRPTGFQIIECAAAGDGSHGPDIGVCPEALHLETTHQDGQIVAWFDDNWWLETLRRWKDRSLTIQIMPTADALLHPIVLHELEMVRRLQTPWRLIGNCYLSDIGHPLRLPRVAVNHYDEIRVIDKDRPCCDAYEARPSKLTLDEVFDQVRTIQSAEKVSAPLLTRAPEPRL